MAVTANDKSDRQTEKKQMSTRVPSHLVTAVTWPKEPGNWVRGYLEGQVTNGTQCFEPQAFFSDLHPIVRLLL